MLGTRGLIRGFLLMAIVFVSGCSDGADATTDLGKCNDVAQDEGCLEIVVSNDFDGWVRVTPLTGGGGGVTGSFLQVDRSESVGSDVKAGAYRVEAFIASPKPDVLATPDCFESVRVRAGFGLKVFVESDGGNDCTISPP